MYFDVLFLHGRIHADPKGVMHDEVGVSQVPGKPVGEFMAYKVGLFGGGWEPGGDCYYFISRA